MKEIKIKEIKIKEIYLSWKEFDCMCKKLTKVIKNEMEEYNFDGIYGLPGGGLPLAVCLSHSLNLPLLMYPTENTLVVDDISDTGKTLKSHVNKKIATLYSSNWTIVKPNWYVKMKKNKNSWIMFPWEKIK
jgi:uncharacterized protein